MQNELAYGALWYGLNPYDHVFLDLILRGISTNSYVQKNYK